MANPTPPPTGDPTEQWHLLAQQVDQGLALGKVVRELFWFWENEHTVGTCYTMEALTPGELRCVMDLLTGTLRHASALVYDMEPIVGEGNKVGPSEP
jgi:hypothetical protein